MKKKTFLILLFVIPILFFGMYHFLLIITGSPESLKYEMIGAILCGGAISIGLWNLYGKSRGRK
jgi:hypothetical protein